MFGSSVFLDIRRWRFQSRLCRARRAKPARKSRPDEIVDDLFLLAFDRFGGGVAQADAFLVRCGERSLEAPSALEAHRDLCPYGLAELCFHLQRLVQPGRGDSQGVVFHVAVESIQECIVDRNAVFHLNGAL